jgi:hypothetical protein
VARNALLAIALIAALGSAGCAGQDDEARAAAATGHSTLAALTAATDSTRPRPDSARADSVRADSIAAAAGLTDSLRRAREIEVMRETFAYAGGTRDPFASLINSDRSGPEFADLELVGVYQNLRTPANSIVVLREKVTAKRYKLRAGDQVGRARLVQIRPRDAVFTIQDFGFERQETLSLRKQEVETP